MRLRALCMVKMSSPSSLLYHLVRTGSAHLDLQVPIRRTNYVHRPGGGVVLSTLFRYVIAVDAAARARTRRFIMISFVSSDHSQKNQTPRRDVLSAFAFNQSRRPAIPLVSICNMSVVCVKAVFQTVLTFILSCFEIVFGLQSILQQLLILLQTTTRATKTI